MGSRRLAICSAGAADRAATAHAIELGEGCAVCLSGRAVAEARLGERDAAQADARLQGPAKAG